jgi:hypothetical protein
MGTHPSHGLRRVDGGIGVGGMFSQRVAQHKNIESAAQKSRGDRVGFSLRQKHVSPARGDDHRRPGMLQRVRPSAHDGGVEEDRLQGGGPLLIQINNEMAHEAHPRTHRIPGGSHYPAIARSIEIT